MEPTIFEDDVAQHKTIRRHSLPSYAAAVGLPMFRDDVILIPSTKPTFNPEVGAEGVKVDVKPETGTGQDQVVVTPRPTRGRRKGVYEFVNSAFTAGEDSDATSKVSGDLFKLETDNGRPETTDAENFDSRPVTTVTFTSGPEDSEVSDQLADQRYDLLESVETDHKQSSINGQNVTWNASTDGQLSSAELPRRHSDSRPRRIAFNDLSAVEFAIPEEDERGGGDSGGSARNRSGSEPANVTSSASKRRRGILHFRNVSVTDTDQDSSSESNSANNSIGSERKQKESNVTEVSSDGSIEPGETNVRNLSAGHIYDQSTVFNLGGSQNVRPEQRVDVDKPAEGNSEKTTNVDDDVTLRLASIYVTDCIHGREEDFLRDGKSIRYYEVYNHVVLRALILVCGWVLLCLALFEDPSVTAQPAPVWATMLIELIIMCIFAGRLIHRYLFTGPSVFFRKNWQNIVIIIVIALTVIDIVSYLLWQHLAAEDMAAKSVRWARPLRPVFLVMFPESRWICKGFFNICRTLPDIIHIVVLWLVSIMLFSLAAFEMFKDKNFFYPNGLPYFSNYFDSFWDMYTCITTANNPDVMMPIYDVNNGIVLFFVLHTVTNLYVFLNILLATIYTNFKEHLKNDVRDTVYMYRRLLLKAFNLLSIRVGNGVFAVTRDRWRQLIDKVRPQFCNTKVEFMFYLLDEDHSDMLEKNEFLQLRDLFTIDIVEVKPKKTFLERHCGAVYNSVVSVKTRAIVTSRYFTYLFDILILVNIVCIGLNIPSIWWFFLAMYTLEITAYLYANGPVKFFSFKMNIFDFLLIIVYWVTTIGAEVLTDPSARETDVNLLLVLRIVRVVRVAHNLGRFRVVLTTISKLIPFFIQYGCILMFLYYVFAIICMDIFKGKVRFFGYVNLTNETNFCGNPALEASDFFNCRYCKNNFNNILSAYVVLYDLMVVNQWQVTASGFVLATDKSYRILFISFHIVCVHIFLNIFAAFILEVYGLVFTLTTNKVELRIETKVAELRNGLARSQTAESLRRMASTMSLPGSSSDSDIHATATTTTTGSMYDLRTHSRRHRAYADLGGLRYKLKKKRSMQLELILQQLFENEIDPTDVGDRAPDEAEAQTRTRRLTLSAI